MEIYFTFTAYRVRICCIFLSFRYCWYCRYCVSRYYIFYVYDIVWSEVCNFIHVHRHVWWKLLSMFHLHCNFVNLWRMAKQSSRYALKTGLGQALTSGCSLSFNRDWEIWVKGSHLLYWATNQPESFTSDVRRDVLEIAKIYPSQVWCHVRESACERFVSLWKIWVLISDYCN